MQLETFHSSRAAEVTILPCYDCVHVCVFSYLTMTVCVCVPQRQYLNSHSRGTTLVMLLLWPSLVLLLFWTVVLVFKVHISFFFFWKSQSCLSSDFCSPFIRDTSSNGCMIKYVSFLGVLGWNSPGLENELIWSYYVFQSLSLSCTFSHLVLFSISNLNIILNMFSCNFLISY